MTKILHTISSMNLSAGGPTSCLWNLVKGLQKESVDVSVLTFAPGSGDKLVSDESLIKTVSLPRFPRYGFSLEYRNALEGYKDVNLIHANALWQYNTHAAAAFARKHKIPLVISLHGMLYPEGLKKSKWIKKISLMLYQRKDIRQSTVLHATCHQEMEYIRALGYKNPIAVIPNSIEMPTLTKAGSALNKTPFRIGFIGRLAPIKNLENLIKAWSDAGAGYHDWELVLIGDGEVSYTSHLKDLASSLQVPNIKFTGFLSGEAKDEVVDSLSFLVLPSKSENFGMVVLEALLRGIPVIASKGTPWEELDTHRCGWWVYNDVENLSATIRKAITLPEQERIAMGEQGINLVRNHYSVDVVARKMLNLYKWILTGHNKPEYIY